MSAPNACISLQYQISSTTFKQAMSTGSPYHGACSSTVNNKTHPLPLSVLLKKYSTETGMPKKQEPLHPAQNKPSHHPTLTTLSNPFLSFIPVQRIPERVHISILRERRESRVRERKRVSVMCIALKIWAKIYLDG